MIRPWDGEVDRQGQQLRQRHGRSVQQPLHVGAHLPPRAMARPRRRRVRNLRLHRLVQPPASRRPDHRRQHPHHPIRVRDPLLPSNPGRLTGGHPTTRAVMKPGAIQGGRPVNVCSVIWMAWALLGVAGGVQRVNDDSWPPRRRDFLSGWPQRPSSKMFGIVPIVAGGTPVREHPDWASVSNWWVALFVVESGFSCR
jgi:hypothetical protein